MTASLEGVSGQQHAPAAPYDREDPIPILQEAGRPHGRSGGAGNLVLTGIRSWTVQPVAQSLYRLS